MPANEDILEGEIQPESTDPALVRIGTLAWLRQQDVVEYAGVMLPSTHRIPEGASLAPADGPMCRVVIEGERCKGTRLLAYGICMGHAGGGGTSQPDAMSAKGTAKLKELKVTRQLLGIGPRSAGNPRAAARLLAAQRANELASAIVSGPLDARGLTPLERQTAALKAVDATFPLQTATVSLSSSDPEDMSWNDMQQLAASLLG